MNDKISNLIISIKNAGMRGIDTITVPYSNLTLAILEVLEREGYVSGITKKGKKVAKTLEVGIVYDEARQPRVSGVERVSKFSRRVYSGFKNIHSVKSGYGKMIITTPKGIMTDLDAKKQRVGGETLFKIW